MKFYKESNKASLTGTALLSYEILKYTTNAVFIAINLDYYNDNNTLVSNSTEIYGRDPAIDKEYKLIRMSVKYNNPRKNEIIVE
jgi:predicted RND superfamily exporter protein